MNYLVVFVVVIVIAVAAAVYVYSEEEKRKARELSARPSASSDRPKPFNDSASEPNKPNTTIDRKLRKSKARDALLDAA